MKIFNQAKSMNISKLILAVAIVVAVNFAANAQPGSTTGGFDDEPQDVPVDGGISLLAIAGAAYGYKKLKNSYHNKK
ncbi:MAG: hypothetical protein WCI53_05605 [Bacteroidota bacterium]|jgi:hypothetical protein